MKRPNLEIATRIGVALAAILIAGVVSIIMAFPVKWLWNWLCPEVFGLPVISVLQAWGLSLLSSLLLKPYSAKQDKKD
jgi:xanthine/uracil permease